MNRMRLVAALAIFVLALSVSVASAATESRLGSSGTIAFTQPVNIQSNSVLQSGGRSAIYLIASFQSSRADDKGRDDFKDKSKARGRDKDKFHGEEMSSTAIVIAGLFALTAYVFFVRRRSQKRT